MIKYRAPHQVSALSFGSSALRVPNDHFLPPPPFPSLVRLSSIRSVKSTHLSGKEIAKGINSGSVVDKDLCLGVQEARAESEFRWQSNRVRGQTRQ